jgi:hypothetical protein
LITTAALTAADLDARLPEWPRFASTSGTARPLPPKSSSNPDGKASLPDAELAALTRGSHCANEQNLPYGEKILLVASEIAGPRQLRDRRAPPPEIAASRNPSAR